LFKRKGGPTAINGYVGRKNKVQRGGRGKKKRLTWNPEGCLVKAISLPGEKGKGAMVKGKRREEVKNMREGGVSYGDSSPHRRANKSWGPK